MKTLNLILSLALVLGMSSCVVHTEYGPHGYDGRAYFGVDYHNYPPWSYWDNNPSVPENPFFGDFYRTNAGVFEFEYFINPYDYWYGTYEMWIERGTPGGPYGEPGYDGIDTYLLLYLDPTGWHEDRFERRQSTVIERTENEMTVEVNEAGSTYRIKMTKTNVNERPTSNAPKFLSTRE